MRQSLGYLLAERYKSQDSHLEMLHSEWDSHDGKAAYDTKSNVEECYFNSAEQYPKYVHKNCKAASIVCI